MNIFKNYPKCDTPLEQIPWYWQLGITEALVTIPILGGALLWAIFFN